MAMDWLANLAAQDKSFESLMAQRNLEKQLGTLLDVQQVKARQDEAEARRVEDARQFNVREKGLSEERQLRTKERQDTEKRQRYNTIHDNLKPGDRMKSGPDLDLMKEFGTGEQFTPDPTDPDSFIYLQHAYDTAVAKQKRDDALREAAEKRAQRDQQLQEEAAKRAQAEEQRRIQREERAQKAFEARQKDIDNRMSKLPPVKAQQAGREQQVYLKTNPQGWRESDEEYGARVHQAFSDIITKAEDEAIAAGQMHPRAPVVQPSGRGAGPGTFKSLEDLQKAFPGATITPVGPGGM